MRVKKRLRNLLCLAIFSFLFLKNIQAELKVLATSPTGRTEGRDQSYMITVTFNQPLVPLEKITENEAKDILKIDPKIEGKYRWQGTSVLSFIPDKPLPLATKFTVTVNKGVKSLISGEIMAGDYTWNFETLRPYLLMSYPIENQNWVDTRGNIYLFFNQPMDPQKAPHFIKLKEQAPEGKESELNYNISYLDKKDKKLAQVWESYQAYTILNSTTTYTLVIKPEGYLKKDCAYSVELLAGLPAAAGDLGLFSRRLLRFQTYKTFRFIRPSSWDGLEPSAGLEFDFSNPVSYKDFFKQVSINPPVKIPEQLLNLGQFTGSDTQREVCPLYFSTDLKPNTRYSVTIKGALKDKFGQNLGSDIKTYFMTTNFSPRMSMPQDMGVVESYLEPARHPLSLLNLNRVRLQMSLIDENNIVQISSNTFVANYLVTPKTGWQVDRYWEINIPPNIKTVKPIELKEVLGNKKSGIVYIQVDALQALADGNRYRQALLQVTPLGITTKFSPNGNLIYVSYLRNSLPASNCSIQLRSENNVLLWSGKTNSSGFVLTPGWEELNITPARRWNKPKLWVIANDGENIAFIHSDWGTGVYPYHFNIPYEWSPEHPKYAGHIFSERGIYRPGETVHLKGIIRENRAGQWAIPRIKEYNLFVKDSRNAEIFKLPVTLSEFGSFDYTFTLGKNTPTGYYTIYFWQKSIKEQEQKSAVGAENEFADEEEAEHEYNWNDRSIRLSSSFRVEEFKPAAFEVSVNSDKEEYILDDTATIKINGNYLFGAPVAEGALFYTLRLSSSNFQPEGYQGYYFGNYSYWGEEDNYNRYLNNLITSGKAKLDKDGNFTFSGPLTASAPGTFSMTAEGLITAPDRQQLAARKTAVVHGGEYYIGLKPKSSFIEKGKKFEVDLITITSDGQKIEDKELQCTLKRVEWNSVRKSGVNGRLEWHTERKETEINKTNLVSKNEPVSWHYLPEVAGYYLFQAEGKDGRGHRIVSNFNFYVTGKDYCGWARGEDDRVELVSDKTKYKPGETAKIMVKSPYEEAVAVVTVEREGIISYWQIKVKGSADTIDIPIKEDYLPNVFVCVMLYHGRDQINENKEDDLTKPSFKIGYANLLVDPEIKHLQVSVIPDKKEYRPEDEVKVKLKVTDASDKGEIAEITMAVVDIGILNLINYQTPNSFLNFYGPRPLSVETAETRLHIIGQRNYGEKGENRGGDGGLSSGVFSGIDIRAKFIPSVYWNPKIITAADGTAEVSFKLPDNLSSFRIMASAQTKTACFGAGENRIIVNKPLILKPSLPRFARLGDTFRAGVLCHNNSKKSGKVMVKVETKGIRLIGENTKEVILEKGEAKEITFDFKADEVAVGEFVFQAKMDNESDGLRWTIPVSVPHPMEAVATYGSTTDGAKEGIKIPSEIYDASSSINLSLAPTALIGVKGGLEYLFNYPYGCLEQKTSEIAPLILGSDFIDMFNLAPLKKHTAHELITEYLAEIQQHQNWSGGLAFWKNGLDSPYLTAYVMWIVTEAKSRGYTVDETMKEKALQYLRAYLHGNKTGWDWPYSVNAELTTKAFIVYVLSLNGLHEQPYINNLYQKLDQMSLFGKVYLLKAASLEKMDPIVIEKLTQDLNNRIKVEPTKAHYEEADDRGMEWIWNSNVRTTAIILQGLLESQRKFPNAEKIVHWLATERNAGRWMNTQDNMYVFYAFQEYVNNYEKENPAFTAAILLNSKEVMRELFKDRTLEAKSVSLTIGDYPRNIILPVDISKTGQGRLYYELRMIYAPQGELKPMERGIFIEKKIEPLKSESNPANTYSLGQKYKITLKIKTEQERQFVAVDDPLPAGFEVINLNFATESQETAREFYESNHNAYSWWGSFNHSENYDDRVLIFADYLSGGEHTYSYLIQATTPGEFLLPPAKIEEMYTPEVFGRTGQKWISIK